MLKNDNLWTLARDYARLADTAWLAGDWQCFHYWNAKLSRTMEKIENV